MLRIQVEEENNRRAWSWLPTFAKLNDGAAQAKRRLWTALGKRLIWRRLAFYFLEKEAGGRC